MALAIIKCHVNFFEMGVKNDQHEFLFEDKLRRNSIIHEIMHAALEVRFSMIWNPNKLKIGCFKTDIKDDQWNFKRHKKKILCEATRYVKMAIKEAQWKFKKHKKVLEFFLAPFLEDKDIFKGVGVIYGLSIANGSNTSYRKRENMCIQSYN
ncbi:hypothetical protein SLE2022_333110 [Rubroshorea leprosula]